jgi:hypothetical protein
MHEIKGWQVDEEDDVGGYGEHMKQVKVVLFGMAEHMSRLTCRNINKMCKYLFH